MENTHLETYFAALESSRDIERIASPAIGFPSILTPGSILTIEVFAEEGLPSDTSAWHVHLCRGVRRITIENETTSDQGTYYYSRLPLTVLEVSHDYSQYRLAAQISPDSQIDLYDLTVQVDDKVFAQYNAVQVVEGFPSQPQFCLVADPHIGFEGYPFIEEANIDEISIFANQIQHINHIHPDFVIILGDLVDWTSAENWENLRNLLKLFQVPVFTVIGNHDYYWDNWWVGYPPLLPAPVRSDPVALRYYLKHINPSRRYSFDYGPVHAACLDSGDDAVLAAVEAFGSGLTDDDLRWLENDLRGKERSFVFMHHPVTRSGSKKEFKRRASTGCITKNRLQFMDLCSRCSVAAVFSGHEHVDEHWCEGGVHYHTTPSVTRSHEENGYRLVRLNSNGGYDTQVIADSH